MFTHLCVVFSPLMPTPLSSLLRLCPALKPPQDLELCASCWRSTWATGTGSGTWALLELNQWSWGRPPLVPLFFFCFLIIDREWRWLPFFPPRSFSPAVEYRDWQVSAEVCWPCRVRWAKTHFHNLTIVLFICIASMRLMLVCWLMLVL